MRGFQRLLCRTSSYNIVVRSRNGFKLPGQQNTYNSNSLLVRGINTSIDTLELDTYDISENFNRQNKDFSQIKEISDNTQWLYCAMNLEQPDLHDVLALLNAVKHQHYKATKSTAFEMGYDLIDRLHKYNLADLTHLGKHCEEMSEVELTALLYKLLMQNKKDKRFAYCQVKVKHMLLLLEREMCRRLYSCYEEKESCVPETVLKYYEVVLHLMLKDRIGGSKFFKAYTRYCSTFFDRTVNMTNISLLLLSIIKVRFATLPMFEHLENYMFSQFSSFDLRTLSLFCVTFFICNTQISSEQLLDRFGLEILNCFQESCLREADSSILINILKILRFSGYSKMSFYCDLELSLVADDTLEKFNISELMHILSTYTTFKICPTLILERLVSRCKSLLRRKKLFRTKDIGSLVHMLGLFQYKDPSDQDDIYTLCTNVLLTQLKSGNYKEPDRYTATYLSVCASGLAYAGKFHNGIFDALFGIPDVLLYLNGKYSNALFWNSLIYRIRPSYSTVR